MKLYKNFFTYFFLGMKSMKDSDFIFDCVHLSYYKCHKTNFKLNGSYIDSSD